MKKKVIALVIDTDLTNEEICRMSCIVELHSFDLITGKTINISMPARNVRVLDSDEIKEKDEGVADE